MLEIKIIILYYFSCVKFEYHEENNSEGNYQINNILLGSELSSSSYKHTTEQFSSCFI